MSEPQDRIRDLHDYLNDVKSSCKRQKAELKEQRDELLEALKALRDFGNNPNSKHGSWALDKADSAIKRCQLQTMEKSQ